MLPVGYAGVAQARAQGRARSVQLRLPIRVESPSESSNCIANFGTSCTQYVYIF